MKITKNNTATLIKSSHLGKEMLRLYRKPALPISEIRRILKEWDGQKIDAEDVATEWCYYVQTDEPLREKDRITLEWLLAETFEPDNFNKRSFLSGYETVMEAGPRLNFETAWSSTAVSICASCGIENITRIEKSLRLGIQTELTAQQRSDFLVLFYDRMTQMEYSEPLESFVSGIKPEPVRIIPLLEEGTDALRTASEELGLSFDEQDIEMISDLFINILKRNPTDVELYQIGQANSEHSRHLFFTGNLNIDGQIAPKTLMEIIKNSWRRNPGNSLLAFNGSVIRGQRTNVFAPRDLTRGDRFSILKAIRNIVGTAETHNYPTGVNPYHGAETGPGGRIRDIQVGAGRGGLFGIGGAGYCTGNLHLPEYKLPWEKDGWTHPSSLASPSDILIKGSDGASDCQNCFGEPLVYGFTRTCGLLSSDEYRAFFKPILYTVGCGQTGNEQAQESEFQKGIILLEVGGPAYRIGLGGASGSSKIQGSNADLDFDAVQRGNPEMEQRMNRLIRACVELGENNPIVSIQDLGAGGNCNALPELVYPAGARVNLRAIPLGDKSLSVLEYWCNEAQERNAFLIHPKHLELIEKICQREKIPCAQIGEITGDGRFVLYDEENNSCPVDLPLDKVLGKIPPKTFKLQKIKREMKPLELPDDLTMFEALNRVLRLPSVCSKRFLTTKADRSVTGLVAQQQCVGPNHLPLSDYAVMLQGYGSKTGVALSLGEQPIKGLISPEAAARLSVSEAILNMAGAKITKFEDIKLLANWMLAAKLPGEGVWLYDAVCALDDMLSNLGIAVIGGKDSLSMAVETTDPEGDTVTVKAPPQLVISAFAPMTDIAKKVTPELKAPGNTLFFIDMSNGKDRLSGSALAQVYQQVGDECPDVDDVALLKRAFETVQKLISKELILSIHDRSDGGLITTLLEMSFAGNVGLNISTKSENKALEFFFNEEPGLVIESDEPQKVRELFEKLEVPIQKIGTVGEYGGRVTVRHNSVQILDKQMTTLRLIWEETSTALDMLQANPECVKEETLVNSTLVSNPPYKLTFKPKETPREILQSDDKPKIAILREEGSNGDREMAYAFRLAGFEVWDITMTDLIFGKANLDDFRGIAFVGGFTFGDVMDAGKGWAGVIRFNPEIKKQFDRFYERQDTFSLGVCNGCQLMALLGWIPWKELPDEKQPRFIGNESQRFESRFSTVRIMESPSIMLREMEGSTLGVWVAHGQGKLYVPDREIMEKIIEAKLAPVRFVNNIGSITKSYPFNPNGSPEGITALCSPDGRHLAMMPHPERTTEMYQWPWTPNKWKDLSASPWLKMFRNAYHWCVENK